MTTTTPRYTIEVVITVCRDRGATPETGHYVATVQFAAGAWITVGGPTWIDALRAAIAIAERREAERV